jgi:hypothetical protein
MFLMDFSAMACNRKTLLAVLYNFSRQMATTPLFLTLFLQLVNLEEKKPWREKKGFKSPRYKREM